MQLIEAVLTQRVKAVFKLNTHPKVSAATGRSLSRPVGGEGGAQDYYEGQLWKRYPGLINVLDWCVKHLKPAALEKLWHLVVPPVMTLLDDYEFKYKLLSLPIVDHLLDSAPGELLRRTGINELLITSFKTALTFLRAPETPQLIRSVIFTWLKLTERSTSPATANRFEQLWALLGEGIIETVWLYGFNDADTIQASVEALPDVVRALGIGAARYLKALISQLVLALIPAPENSAPIAFQISSVRALDVLVAECAPRMHKWKGTILDGVCRCWASLVESGADNTDVRELKMALRETCGTLAAACPSVATSLDALLQEEFRRLLEMDEQIFKALVAPSSSESR
ncbi:uncharacterized protein PHACADRAFT_181556 [Phanerochaete carnosa HHB-10118-sp]|uniref:Uncharacterized protein n=1 Tax=Phanerochaete carnosa (strain HHB-10118-sp) TaxID=650164 RepID=K5X9I3_PHACS|nr:uncharacterized protein PHACADRAFT_181556 [Phanerochaete carnosa HHB-10118-sp]EKM59557.1 hypothetical protein PHACADRAFT_181556 [Phanerochaete carnosa HHB-10118-sp]